jgi:hypothetical protein
MLEEKLLPVEGKLILSWQQQLRSVHALHTHSRVPAVQACMMHQIWRSIVRIGESFMDHMVLLLLCIRTSPTIYIRVEGLPSRTMLLGLQQSHPMALNCPVLRHSHQLLTGI